MRKHLFVEFAAFRSLYKMRDVAFSHCTLCALRRHSIYQNWPKIIPHLRPRQAVSFSSSTLITTVGGVRKYGDYQDTEQKQIKKRPSL